MSTLFYYAGLCWFVLFCLGLAIGLLRLLIRPPRPSPELLEMNRRTAADSAALWKRYQDTQFPD